MRLARERKALGMMLRRVLEQRTGLAVRRYPIVGTGQCALKDFLIHNSVDLVVDVGAHVGEFAQILRNDLGYRGNIRSFEPSLDAFSELAQLAKNDERWWVHNLALGSKKEFQSFHVYSDPRFNSIHKLLDHEATHFELHEYADSTVSVERLDDTFEPSWGSRVLLKSDTQGNDLAVLDGCAGFESRIVGFQAEAGVRPIYEGIPSLTQVVDNLASRGFLPISFDLVSRDSKTRVPIEFDILFGRAPDGSEIGPS